MNRAERRRIAAYCRERDEVLRQLDIEGLEAHMRKWKVPMPKEWIGAAPLILMHKARLSIVSFTEAEKAVSREWLSSRGYDLDG
jgi:hypothetical protein